MPSYVPAKRATAYVTYVSLIDQASGKVFRANPTVAAGDVKVSIDGGAFANLTTLPVVTPAGSKLVKVSLSAAEMTGDTITVLFSDVAGAEWNDLLEVIDTAQRQLDDLAYPTVSGRSLDVTATGAAGIDWGNVENPTTALALTGTTLSSSQVVASVTGSVGSVTGSVGSVTGNVGGNVNGSVAIVGPGAIASGSFALGAITAAVIAPDAIGASELAADAVAEIADAVWDEALAGHLAAGSTGAALNAAGAAGDPWATLLPGAYGAGTAGNIMGTRLDVAVSTRLAPTVAGRTLDVTTTGEAGLDWGNIGAPTTTQALTGTTLSSSQVVASVTGSVGSVTGSVGSVTGSVGSVTGSVGSVTGAVGSVTGSVGSVAGNVSGNVTGSVGSVAANGITAASLDPTAGAEIADAVWDEGLAGHLTAGSTGAALQAGASGDPWTVPLPGAYSVGTAGFLVGTNLDATVSSRATQASVTTVGGDVTAIKAKTDNLPVDPADNSQVLAAIAAVPTAPTALQNADALLNRDMSAVSDTNPRTPLMALRFMRNKWSLSAGVLTVTKENDTTTAWTSAVTTDAAALPVTASDPT